MKKTKGKALFIAAAIVAAFLVIAGGRELEAYARRKAWEREAIAVYPMANKNITWSGAGYNGIYGKGSGK